MDAVRGGAFVRLRPARVPAERRQPSARAGHWPHVLRDLVRAYEYQQEAAYSGARRRGQSGGAEAEERRAMCDELLREQLGMGRSE
eukprot:2564490-Prymnesium_polylepis.1